MHLPWEVVQRFPEVAHRLFDPSGGRQPVLFLRKVAQKVHGLKWEDVREIQGNKWEDRSGFDAGVVLVRVEE